jgi:hypothetical protein
MYFSVTGSVLLCGGHRLVFDCAGLIGRCWYGMIRLWPTLRSLVQVVQRETILGWHRTGFKVFWHWKSRKQVGRPKIDRGLRDLIQ